MTPRPPGKTLLVGGSVLFGATGLLGCLPALLSPMLFDAPGSTGNPATMLLFLSVVTYPLVAGAAVVAAWVFFAKGKPRAARTAILLPLLSWLCLGVAWVWLTLGYDGNLG